MCVKQTEREHNEKHKERGRWKTLVFLRIFGDFSVLVTDRLMHTTLGRVTEQISNTLNTTIAKINTDAKLV